MLVQSVGKGCNSWVSGVDHISPQVIEPKIHLNVSSMHNIVDLTVTVTDWIIFWVICSLKGVWRGLFDTERSHNCVVLFVVPQVSMMFGGK